MVKIRKGSSSRIVVTNARYIFDQDYDTVVIEGGRVTYLGSEDNMNIDLGSEDTIIDAEGLFIAPGLIDSHIHIWSTALSRKVIDLRDTYSIEDLKRKIMNAEPVGGVILGRGWDQDRFPDKKMPTRHDLDDIASDKPVVLVRVCGHIAVVNSKAMEYFGLYGNRELDKYIIKDQDGKPTGVIVEDAVGYIMKKINEKIDMGDIYLLEDFLIDLASKGVTSVGMMNASKKEIELAEKLYRARKKYVRLHAYLSKDELKRIGELDKSIVDGFLVIEGVKLFSDGSFGGRTAYLYEDYNDDPGNRGLKLLDRDELANVISIARRHRLQVAVHAIGDAALDHVLETADQSGFRGVENLRIEHASLLSDKSIELLKKVKPGVSIQPRFTVSDFWIESRLGRKRSNRAYMFKTLMNLDLCVSCSSDSPVEPYDPNETLKAALFRGPGGPNISESLSIGEALKIYTQGGGCILRRPKLLGCIDRGCVGDFILFDYRYSHSIDVKLTHIAGSGIFIRDQNSIEVQPR